jgi:tRNA uridine 5-carboxymethylaminomethyl modification enzyme
LLLREDNADLRLTEKGRELGLVDDTRWAAFSAKRENIEIERQRLADCWVQPGSSEAAILAEKIDKPLSHEYNLLDLLKRPELKYVDLAPFAHGTIGIVDEQIAEQIEIGVKYAGYIDRQQLEIDRLRRYEDTCLPLDFDYSIIEGLSNEVKQKLGNTRPQTLAQASRIPGVTPAAVSLLLIYLKKRGLLDRKSA